MYKIAIGKTVDLQKNSKQKALLLSSWIFRIRNSQKILFIHGDFKFELKIIFGYHHVKNCFTPLLILLTLCQVYKVNCKNTFFPARCWIANSEISGCKAWGGSQLNLVFHFVTSIKGTSRDLVIKSKQFLYCGFVAWRQLKPIHKRGS